jgi:hypothetical protein
LQNITPCPWRTSSSILQNLISAHMDSETLLRIRSLAGYTIDTHESRFRKRHLIAQLIAFEIRNRGSSARSIEGFAIRHGAGGEAAAINRPVDRATAPPSSPPRALHARPPSARKMPGRAASSRQRKASEFA